MAHAGEGAIRVIRSGAGPRVKPRSLVRLEVEGVDPVDGRVAHHHEILLVVPPLGMFPGYSFPSAYGPELSDVSRAQLDRRGVGYDPALGPAVVTHWGEAPLPWDGIYRMREGGRYELPHPTMATIRGLNEPSARSFSLPRRETPGVAYPGLPIVRLAVLATCPADLRLVEHTYVEWSREYIPYPRRVRTESWHELHGCAR